MAEIARGAASTLLQRRIIMLGISFFRKAGATGHVFHLASGKVADKGVAHSGIVGPLTTVAVVPTVPQIFPFSIDAQTLDKQDVTVDGNLTVTLVPGTAITKFDFTVD